MSADQIFLAHSATLLGETYPQRIERALALIQESDLWWQPHSDTTSIGKLMLHLEGNIRQWVLSGLAGEADHRQRAKEFQPDSQPGSAELLAALQSTTQAAAKSIASFEVTRLDQTIEIQGFKLPALEAIYHVVEHFSWHCGQIAWMAKQKAGEQHGLAYYDENQINSGRNPSE